MSYIVDVAIVLFLHQLDVVLAFLSVHCPVHENMNVVILLHIFAMMKKNVLLV